MSGTGTERSGHWSVLTKFLVVVFVAAAFAAGYYTAGPSGDKSAATTSADSGSAEAPKKAEVWTCSMHPQIKLPEFGKCPICFMDLIPLEKDESDEGGPVRYSMSERAKILAQIRTTEVKRERAATQIRMVGMVFEDETRIAAITSRVPGRLDAIHVDFTGVKVDKGDPLVTIWSPRLISTQVELFETLRSPEFDESVAEGAVEKLKQYGLTQDQIDEIRRKQEPMLNITLRSPIKGVVMEKNALLGHFVQEGTVMYTITDLSVVWVKLDAFETDLPWLRYGQEVTFTTPAIPGREFRGKILFIDPVLQMETRSVKVRVEAENPDMALKPNMFVTARVHVELDHEGRVINPDWTGKYVCPVHPESVGEEASDCPKTDKPRKPAHSFGYAPVDDPILPLTIPKTAPLFTGKRSVVYVEVPDAEKPTYELREVVLGPEVGDKYIVYEGLHEGERVVSYGNFKIDSALQIMAKPSMMIPAEEEEPEPEEQAEVIEQVRAPDAFLKGLSPVLTAYFKLAEALVTEKPDDAVRHSKELREHLEKIAAEELTGDAAEQWKELSDTILRGLKNLEKTTNVESQRTAFDPTSEALARVLLAFRHSMDHPVHLFFCPMAFDNRGAYWLEENKDLRNPYFGDEMLKCGELAETVPPEGASASPEEQTDGQPEQPQAEGGSGSKPKDSPAAAGSEVKHDNSGSGSKSKDDGTGSAPKGGDR